MKAYKLTDHNGQTRGGLQWGEDITHSAKGSSNQRLCSDGWIHFYRSKELAIVMNPNHANFTNLILWECETSGKELHEPLKSGCQTLTTTKKIPLPIISLNSKIIFAILCGKQVYQNIKWNNWADNWISNKDRSKTAAAAAAAIAAAAADAIAADAIAADAADSYAAYAAAYATYAADTDAIAAAYAAHAADAADAAKNIDFQSLILQAMSMD